MPCYLKISSLVILAILVLSGCDSPLGNTNSQKLHPEITIARWLYDSDAALTFTFDDNGYTHHIATKSVLDNYHFKASFFVNPGYTSWLDVKEGYRILAENGYEVGNHSWRHRDLPTLDPEALQYEVVHTIQIITEDLGFIPLTFVHPFNSTNQEVDDLVLQTHLFSRITSPYSMKFRHEVPIWQKTTVSRMINELNFAVGKGMWLIVTAHGVDDLVYTHLTISSVFLVRFCQHISEREERIWVDTLGQIAHYEYLRNEIVFVTHNQGNLLLVSLLNYNSEKYSELPHSKITLIIVPQQNTRIISVDSSVQAEIRIQIY